MFRRRKQREQDLERELRQDRRAAQRSLGNLALIKEDTRAMRSTLYGIAPNDGLVGAAAAWIPARRAAHVDPLVALRNE